MRTFLILLSLATIVEAEPCDTQTNNVEYELNERGVVVQTLVPGTTNVVSWDNSLTPYAGVGMIIGRTETNNPCQVLVVFPGSPAERAGIAKDEFITAIEGNDVRDSEVCQVSTLLRGTTGTAVKIRTTSNDRLKTNEYIVTRALIAEGKK